MKSSRVILLFSLVVALFLFGSLASAQTLTTADVAGVVSDTTGAVVPGVTVTIRFLDTNETRTQVTNEKGEYRFSLLQPGDYILSAEKASLKSKQEKFTLLLGQEQAMNLTMQVQGTQQLVEVNAQTSGVETENANRTTSLTTAQVVDLPSPGGDLTTLAMTTPGIRVNIQGGSGNMNAEGIPGSSILFTLNGADVMDPYNNLNNSGASNNLLGQNEIAEAAVVLNAYSAQYGRMAGGQENLIGKSGTNAFHGNLLYNYNDRIFNANDFFNNVKGTPRGVAISNQYGGAIGGPVWLPKIYNGKNKTFFFFDLEGLRYVLPTTGTVSIPSPQFEQYTLAHIPAASVPLYTSIFNLYNGAPGVSRAVPVTAGSTVLQDKNLGCQTQGSFAGTPAPGGGTFGVNVPCALAFGTNVSQLNTEDLLIARVDQNIGDKQKLSFRYEYDWGVQATAASPINPVFNSVSTQPQDQGQFNYTYVISPTIVNSFIGAASWYTAIFGVANFPAAQALIPERFTFADGGASGSTGFATVGASLPTGRNVGQGQAIDDFSWVLGRHTIKLGGNYRYNKITDTSIASGSVEGTYSIQDLADFAAGSVGPVSKSALASSFTQSYPLLLAAHIRLYSLNFYAQDEWAVSKSLKLTFGYRFERDGNPACVDNCFARMNTQFGTVGYVGGASIPYNQTITTGIHNAYQSLETIIPEPRFGFAWTPFGPNKTVLRGGVGLFANLFAGSVASNVFNNSPNKFTPAVPVGSIGLASDPASGAYSAAASDQAFENGFSRGYTLAQISTSLPKGIAFTPPGYYSPPEEFVAPKVLEWSFEIQQPLSVHNLLDLTYAGNHGYDQSISNLWPNVYLNSSGVNNYPAGFGGLPTSALDPRFYSVNQVLTSGYSNYDALTVQVRHSFSYGFQGQLGYTWSHALGTAYTSTTLLLNPNNLNAQYGNLPFDTRHQLTGDMVWNSPRLSNRALNLIAGGWTIGAKLYLYSGSPINTTNSAIPGKLNSLFTGETVEADLYNPSVLGTSCGTAAITTPCLTASQFGQAAGSKVGPVQTDFGNIQPNSFYGPGYFDIDTQLLKTFHLSERTTFALSAQAYNVLNHPNFLNPSGSVTSSAFGKITSTATPPTSPYGSFEGSAVSGRVLVVGAKFNF